MSNYRMGPRLTLYPITQRVAFQHIRDNHRHHKPPRGWVFGISVVDEDGYVRGVVIVGRPVARMLQDGVTCEVTRLCTDGTMNACSMLYGAAARVAKDLGYKRILTYTLTSEGGASLRASGWVLSATNTGGGSWSRTSRVRTDKAPLEPKNRWERRL